MFGMGLSEILITLVFYGGVAFPISVPPLPEDPLLANIAPQECLFYTQWSGMAEPNPESDNEAEKFLADPEIRRSVAQLEKRMLAWFKKLNEEAPDSPEKLMVEVGPRLAKTVLTRPLAVFLEDFTIKEKTPQIKGGLVVNGGDKVAELKGTMERVQAAALGDRVKKVTVDGSPFYRFQPAPDGPLITWGAKGKYLVVGFGEGVVEGMLRRARTPAPAWLNEARRRFSIKRRSTITYANLTSLMEKISALAPDQKTVAVVLEATGLKGLQSYVAAAGLSEKRFVNHTAIDIQGEPAGFLKAAAGKPLTAADLSPIPCDALVALAERVDVAAFYDALIKVMDQVDRGFRANLAGAEAEIGFGIRKDLLGALGDVWSVYTDADAGGIFTGWTVAVSIRDRKKLAEIQKRIIDKIKESGDPHAAGMVKSLKFAGQEIHYVNVREAGFPLAPAWCVTETHLLAAPFPQAIKSHLSRKSSAPSIAETPQVAAALRNGQGLLGLVYYDPKPVIELAYPAIQMMVQSVSSLPGMDEGPQFDVTLLPTVGALTRHVRPSIYTWRKTSAGFETTLRQSLPGGNSGSVAPIMIALLMPATSAASGAARRAQGTNNLRQIGLAMHNYHAVYGGLPARSSLSKEGKPLLSWRVHILPFVEQRGLYEQFHLDEPWDSEHNKKLIAQMPDVYRSPNSKAPPGKTVYLAIAGKSAIFPKPKDDQKGQKTPLGVGIRDITDGTSNTGMVISANDKAAVTWTKPDDFDLDNPMMMDIRKILFGQYPGGFNMLYADGSVRFLPKTIDPKILQAIFTRSGGEVVRVP